MLILCEKSKSGDRIEKKADYRHDYEFSALDGLVTSQYFTIPGRNADLCLTLILLRHLE